MEKVLSLCVAIAYVAACYGYADAVLLLPVAVLVLPPLVAIWFCSEIASYVARHASERKPVFSATALIRVVSWACLIAVPPVPVIWFFARN